MTTTTLFMMILVFGAAIYAFLFAHGARLAQRLVVLLMMPVFLLPQAPFTNLLPADTSQTLVTTGGVSVPTVVTLLAVLVWSTRTRPVPRLQRLHLLVWSLACWIFLAFAVGALLSGLGGVVYFVQTVAPMSGYFLARSHRLDFDQVARKFAVGSFAGVTLAFVLAAPSFRAGSAIQVSQAIARVIPQFLGIFPFVLGIALGSWLLLADLVPRSLRIVGGLSAACLLFFSWSRSGLLGAGLIFLIAAWLRSSSRTSMLEQASSRVLRVLAFASVGGVLAVQLFANGTLGARYSAGGQLVGDERRVELASEAAARVFNSPVFGDALRPFDGFTAVGASDGGLYPAHNQLLDFGIRGGIPAMALLIAIQIVAVLAGMRWLKRSSGTERGFAGLCLAVVIGASVGGVGQLYFIHGLSALPVWFCIGSISRFSVRRDAQDAGVSVRTESDVT